MPIYEYTCEKCGKAFDFLARTMSQGKDGVKCPACASTRTKRALSVFAVSGDQAKSSSAPSPGMCGRCGGEGPCSME